MSQERLLNILLAPVVSEKAAMIADKGRQITFKVVSDATKTEIRKAVESLFKVTVESVQVLNVKGKTKRRGRITGKRSGWKKAIVSLAEGHDIDFAKID